MQTSVTFALSSFGSRNASPRCSALVYWPISAQYSNPSRASSSRASGFAARRAPFGNAIRGTSGACSARATTSCPVPGSPRTSSGLRAASNCSIWRSTSRTAALVPIAASDTRRGSRAEAVFSARDTVPRSFCSPTGFSRKSNAPIFVASTAVSIVPCPDIMMIGIVSSPAAAHSRRSVTPSVSGIQMSSSTSAGCSRAR